MSGGIAGATHSTSAVTASWHRNQAALMVASFVGFTGFTLVMPFLALHFQALGETDVGTVAAWTGVTLGVTPLVAALCAPLWGRIGDRFGNKILVQRSLASFVLVMGLMAVATESWQLFALRALQGLVAGYGALAIAMAARSAPR
ncbi:MAG TPA: MFS transporter, partial [Candidatus Limnocylindria bacterium]|nr:MFS transporter [Candidatus Limnocylindria bacterium]